MRGSAGSASCSPSGWLWLEIILDRHTHRYLGARHMGAQLALAVVDAPCQRPGETTVCASYLETTWVTG
jgi:hypothetical protein